jgi:hypothetical protein
MLSILSDHDIEFYARLLWMQFTEAQWHRLGLASFAMFVDVGIRDDLPDREVWSYCQEHELLLLTANRNMDGDDSLEAAIRDLGQSDSLPVLTIVRPKWLMNPRYREDCAYRVAEVVLDIENLRGTGRQFIP